MLNDGFSCNDSQVVCRPSQPTPFVRIVIAQKRLWAERSQNSSQRQGNHSHKDGNVHSSLFHQFHLKCIKHISADFPQSVLSAQEFSFL